jgi:2C-methyl-D-erythritol 2,4-cyclodiphosphate synthase
MSSITNVSVQQLRQAANLKEKIAALEKELHQLLGSATKPAVVKVPKKRGMSAAGRASVAAAQRARWAKIKAAKK